MPRRTLAVILIIAGLVITGVALFADRLGIGAVPGVFGWKQILGAVVGLATIAVGIVLRLRETTF